MSLGLWNLQWLNHNSQRAYPIADWASKACSVSADIKLPDDFILAINFAVSSALNVGVDKFYVKAVSIMDSGASILIGYKGYDSTVAVSHLAITDDEDILTAALTGIDEFDDTVGYIAINAKSSMFNLTPGYYTFTYNATAIEPDCIRPMIRSVTSMQIQTAGGYSERMYGDIVLVAGSNIAIDVLERSSTRNVIRISALDNKRYSRGCPERDNDERQAITAINGVTASDTGNITISGINCVSVQGGDSVIYLQDTCAQPCCGCPELNALTAQIQRLADGKSTLEGFLSELIAGVTSLETQILGSK